MIIRQSLLRHGRANITNASWRQARRWLSSETDSIEQPFQNSQQDIHSIESLINSVSLPSNHLQAPNPNSNAPHQEAVTSAIAENYKEFQRQKKLLGSLGAEKAPHYEPHSLVTNPPSPSDVTLELLLASQSHLGHATSLWNPANAQYIFGIRDGVHIISLDVTASYLRRAAKVVSAVTERGGLVLFAGTRAGQDRCVVKAAELAGGCHLFERWIPGSITNGQQILGRCQVKVVDELDQEVPGFDEQLIDRATLKPDLVVCLNPLENYVLLHECALNNIPTIGIIDTDANPTWVTYAIPANDDSLRCVQVIAGVLGRAGEEGKLRRLAFAKQKHYTFTPASGLELPGDLGSTGPIYPRVLKLGSTIQELEEQDRGNAYNYGAGQGGTEPKDENKST